MATILELMKTKCGEIAQYAKQGWAIWLMDLLVLLTVLVGLYGLYQQLFAWWTPDKGMVSDYLSVKGTSVLLGGTALCVLVWLFDLLTPGSWIRKSAENPYSAAIVLSALILGLSNILAH
jgi:hypothetical protein